MNVFWVIYQHINGLFLPKSHLNTLLSTLLGSLELDKGTEKEGWVKKKLPGVQNHLTLLIGTQTMMLQGQGGFYGFYFCFSFSVHPALVWTSGNAPVFSSRSTWTQKAVTRFKLTNHLFKLKWQKATAKLKVSCSSSAHGDLDTMWQLVHFTDKNKGFF